MCTVMHLNFSGWLRPHAQVKLVRRCQGRTHHNLEHRYAALHEVFAKLLIG